MIEPPFSGLAALWPGLFPLPLSIERVASMVVSLTSLDSQQPFVCPIVQLKGLSSSLAPPPVDTQPRVRPLQRLYTVTSDDGRLGGQWQGRSQCILKSPLLADRAGWGELTSTEAHAPTNSDGFLSPHSTH